MPSGEARGASYYSCQLAAAKTRIASELIKDARRQGLRALVVAPLLSLINQTTKSFEVDGIGDIGVIQGKHYRTNKFAAVQVASAQTLSRRPVQEGIGLVIVDECHIRDKALHRLMMAPGWAVVAKSAAWRIIFSSINSGKSRRFPGSRQCGQPTRAWNNATTFGAVQSLSPRRGHGDDIRARNILFGFPQNRGRLSL
jgi:hypothetical protein